MIPVPVSAIVVTKNEAQKICGCLTSLKGFDDIWVVDSSSRDGTAEKAHNMGAHCIPFVWNGQYPKKRQWCLETLPLKYEWVFFVDADEIIPQPLIDEINTVICENPAEAGFFITGRYRMHGRILRYGFPNAKIALFHRERMAFPVVDDIDIPGVGEIEGHYQPVLREGCQKMKIGALDNILIHDALDDIRAWTFRHEKYARWEAGMNQKCAWPADPIVWRQKAKAFLRSFVWRAEIVFVSGYILKLGFLDGWRGLRMARMRYWYHKMIKKLS